tara:strand:+ start:112 stop:528 length:417 start_codon:yes stop_codon:yes gene_type:complete
MNKVELKKILKPLIKECIKEVIFEDGTLSTIISEVIKGTSTQQVVYETKTPQRLETNQESQQRRSQLLKEQKKKMLDSIGRDAYNGVDLFEGTSPMTAPRGATSPQGSKALDGVSPGDPGVDISAFGTLGIWKKLSGN